MNYPARGFTLIETVLAITVFAIAAVGVATAIKTAADLAWETSVAERDALESRSFVEEALVRLRYENPPFEIDSESSTILVSSEESGLANEDGDELNGVQLTTIEIKRPGNTDETFQLYTSKRR